jgi:hypothetical protein
VDTCRAPLIEPARGWSCRAAGSVDSCVPLVLWFVARPERTDKRGEAATRDNKLPANRGSWVRSAGLLPDGRYFD